ncbi:MAG: DUF1549 and DUF1553 domain-containing protein [Gemmataceae bacterium]|nr:DUF1549 and DUF1553 domain-containing protein [Gemmataceae bacterium]
MKRLLLFVSALAVSASLSAAEPVAKLKSIRHESARAEKSLLLSGPESWRQLLVAGEREDGRTIDVTRAVRYKVEPADLATIDASGLATPKREGEGTIRIEADDVAPVTARIVVKNMLSPNRVGFATHVNPILSRAACNTGGCHGKAGGQNGFALSLFGFEPEDDYEYLVKEGRGRRLFAASVDSSLMLLKGTGRVAHAGGKRLEYDSTHYRLVRRWIEQGAPADAKSDAVATHIEVSPGSRVLSFQSEQQLAVLAHLSDGRVEDVTRLAIFEIGDAELGEVSNTGLFTAKAKPGVVSVKVRYQALIGVFTATLPTGNVVAEMPAKRNFIDEHVFAQLKSLGLPASEPCDASTFLRRVTLDVTGRLPTVEETTAYLADSSADKEDRLIDRLLTSEDYAYHFANKWSAILRNRRNSPTDDPRPTAAFHVWIKESLNRNKPFDRFVREILTVSGEETNEPPVVWHRETKDAPGQTEDVAQLFLGQRISCAKCHHHPHEKWSQGDYWSMTAFFSRTEVKVGGKKGKNVEASRVYHKPGDARATHPRTKESLKPAGLGGNALEVSREEDARHKLVDWMASPENPYFAKTLVNRYWKHFFGRALVEPEDDLRLTNPPTNPALLDALAKHFIDSGYDLKNLVKTIVGSQSYRLAAIPTGKNADDTQNYSHFYIRRINAEALFDAIDQVTGSKSSFPNMPTDTRAVYLPDNQFESYFLSVFGRPDSASPCECERSNDATLAQVLYMFNSEELRERIGGKRAMQPMAKDPKETKKTKAVNKGGTRGPTLAQGGGRLQKLLKDSRTHEERIRELYLAAFSRPPQADEVRASLAYLDARKDDVASAYEDILWALVNTKEFLFNH